MEEPSIKREERSWPKWVLLFFCCLLVLPCLYGPITGPNGGGFEHAKESSAMLTSRTIGLCLYQYSLDNNGKYPDGASSTEVFQKLMDGKYVTDPTIFYLSKSRPPSDRLRPEYVSWDVTMPIDKNSPDGVPVVFSTGYRVEYKPGGRAVPLADKSRYNDDGIAVSYHSNSAAFLKKSTQPDGSILNFIPADTNLGTTHYIQLTPDGPLSP
jgi:hypothetical protein